MPKSKQPMALRPETGLPRFRRNASLQLQGGAIVATDRRGRSRRFVLDDTNQAPAEVRAFGLGKQGLMDGEGKLLALWENAVWGVDGRMADFCIAAGIKQGIQDTSTLPPMRSDSFSSIGIFAFADLQLHPNRFDEPILIAAFTGGAVSFVLWRKSIRIDPEVAERRHNKYFHGPPRGRSRR